MAFRKLSAVVVIICFTTILTAQNPSTKDNLTKHVYTLAADSMLGRKAGSIQSIKAADYIISQFREIGLQPGVYDANGDTYLESFNILDMDCANVVGLLPGNDPELRNEFIIIGAHYDHIGFTYFMNEITAYNGADDNASGVAMMIELARNIKRDEASLKRTVIFVAFDAEEIGLCGSAYMSSMLEKMPVKFMLNLDMVGWYKKGPVHIKGAATFKDGYGTITNSPNPHGLKLKVPKNNKNESFSSDHFYFSRAGIPSIMITTGLKSPYHRTTDNPEKIDYDGMTKITDYLTNLITQIINLDTIQPTK